MKTLDKFLDEYKNRPYSFMAIDQGGFLKNKRELGEIILIFNEEKLSLTIIFNKINFVDAADISAYFIFDEYQGADFFLNDNKMPLQQLPTQSTQALIVFLYKNIQEQNNILINFPNKDAYIGAWCMIIYKVTDDKDNFYHYRQALDDATITDEEE